ncbi:MAG: glycosyltransferase family 2 protein [Roseobacter sp.]|nr:glycosyltransferase family 2 protein [Roseobacter sp.]
MKAPTDEVLRFAAYHLDAGAHRVWIYLDAPDRDAYDTLDAHPKCTVIDCDEDYWRRIFGRRPHRHQVRQANNATRTHARAGDVDWLMHLDVDEFLVSPRSVGEILQDLPETALTARVRPIELLASETFNGGKMAFKAPVPAGPQAHDTLRGLYPTYGDHIAGGFLSHLEGKVFIRSDCQNATLHIHNAFSGDDRNPGEVALNQMSLAHLHATDWKNWQDHFEYRLAKGAYRPDLAPTRPAEQGGITLHAFFKSLIEQSGTTGLRAFFDEVCADTPALRKRLQDQRLLRLLDLQLDAKLHHHFPDYRPLAATV